METFRIAYRLKLQKGYFWSHMEDHYQKRVRIQLESRFF